MGRTCPALRRADLASDPYPNFASVRGALRGASGSDSHGGDGRRRHACSTGSRACATLFERLLFARRLQRAPETFAKRCSGRLAGANSFRGGAVPTLRLVDPVEEDGLGLDHQTAAAMAGHDDGGWLISNVYTKLAERRAQRAMQAYRQRHTPDTPHLRAINE